MAKLLSLLCAVLMMAAVMGGCAKRAAEDVADTASEVVSDIKDDADEYGKVEDDTENYTDGSEPTLSNMDQMIENGQIDDENDDDYDGDNIDDDKQDDNIADDNAGEDNADGGEHNDETMNEDSSFI